MRAAGSWLVEKVETCKLVHMICSTRRTYLETWKELNESTADLNDRELFELKTKKKYMMFAHYEDYYERIKFRNNVHGYPKYK